MIKQSTVNKYIQLETEFESVSDMEKTALAKSYYAGFGEGTKYCMEKAGASGLNLLHLLYGATVPLGFLGGYYGMKHYFPVAGEQVVDEPELVFRTPGEAALAKKKKDKKKPLLKLYDRQLEKNSDFFGDKAPDFAHYFTPEALNAFSKEIENTGKKYLIGPSVALAKGVIGAIAPESFHNAWDWMLSDEKAGMSPEAKGTLAVLGVLGGAYLAYQMKDVLAERLKDKGHREKP